MTTPITTTTQLEALPVGHVVRSAAGTIAARFDQDRGVVFGDNRPFPWIALELPATVLWPLPAPTVKPGREEVRLSHHQALMPVAMSIWKAVGGTQPDYDALLDALADAVLAILPGKSEQEVRAGALRDAAEALAKRNFLLPRGHAPMPVLVDYLRVLADEEAGHW